MAEGEGIPGQCAVKTSNCEASKSATQGTSLDFPEFHFLNLQTKIAFVGKPGLVPGSPTYEWGEYQKNQLTILLFNIFIHKVRIIIPALSALQRVVVGGKKLDNEWKSTLKNWEA